jgi:hypothetical protein
MNFAWNKHQWACYQASELDSDDSIDFAQKLTHARSAFKPCAGKIQGRYVLSEIARRDGFLALERFIQLVARVVDGKPCSPSMASFDSLKELALACRLKNPTSKAYGKLNARRAHLRPFCRLCGKATEFVAHTSGADWPIEDTHDRLRLSAMFCSEHRAKTPFSDSVKAAYLRAKRSQAKFDSELTRIELQVVGGASKAWAKSGNKLVDEYIRLFASRQLHEATFVDNRLRDEARMLVNLKISDRKKELMMLLAFGNNQSQTARILGIDRQSVSRALKELQTLPVAYRLDLLPIELSDVVKTGCFLATQA